MIIFIKTPNSSLWKNFPSLHSAIFLYPKMDVRFYKILSQFSRFFLWPCSLHSVLLVTDTLTFTSHSPTRGPSGFYHLGPLNPWQLLPSAPSCPALLSTAEENQANEPPPFPQAAGKTFSFLSSLIDLPSHSPPRCSDPFSFTSFQFDSPCLLLRMWPHGLISQTDEGIQHKSLQFCSSPNPHLPFFVTWWIWQNLLHILPHFPSSSGTLFHKLFPLLQHTLFTQMNKPSFYLRTYLSGHSIPFLLSQTSWKMHLQLLSVLQCIFSLPYSLPSDSGLLPSPGLSHWSCCRNHHTWENQSPPPLPVPLPRNLLSLINLCFTCLYNKGSYVWDRKTWLQVSTLALTM